MIRLLLVQAVASTAAFLASAFVASPPLVGRQFTSVATSQGWAAATSSPVTPLGGSTILTPETETERREKRDDNIIPPGEGEVRGPIEWLIDDPLVSRDDEEPFHILLLDDTFVRNARMTVEYAASSCVYVLRMPYDEAAELVAHAKAEGFSCLGTWSHGECVTLGRQLQNRDLVCRVVPFCEGGDRAWQARDAKDGEGMKRAEDGARWG